MKQLNSHDFEEVYKWLGINLDKMGCIMLDLEPLEKDYLQMFDALEQSLYYAKKKDRFWINGWVANQTPHITLLYGLLSKGKSLEPHIQEVLRGWELEEVEIESVGYFESPYEDEQYYCLVAHIKVTPELMEGHQRLEFLPHINTFAGYKPHFTLGYIQKNESYRDSLLKLLNQELTGVKIKVKEEINLGGSK